MEGLLFLLLIIAALALLVLLRRYYMLKAQIETRAKQQYDAWREQDLAGIRRQHEDLAHREAEVELQRWRQESEQGIRKDAIEKSRAVIVGKVTEHVVPFFPGFSHNPKDARFIGSPVDFVVFDGLDEGEVRKITFVEVKTGSSSLNSRERQIRNAIKQQAVEWEEVRVPSPVSQNNSLGEKRLPLQNVGHPCPGCGKENRDLAQFCGYCGRLLRS
jgi:predicted Holliday junction resolvase-like endonuclease